MRHAGRIGTAAALAVAVFLLAGVGLFRSLRADPAPAAGAPSSDALAAPVLAGSLDQEIASLQMRLREAPGDWQGFASLGLAYVQQARVTADPGYYPKAEGVLRRSLQLDRQDNFEAMVGEAALAAARHDFADALRWGEQARAINPYNASVYGVIGDAFVELGRYDEAVTTFQRMVDILPDLSSWARVSYARELMGDTGGAIAAMKVARDYAGSPADGAWASYQLGELYFNSGDLKDAEVAYREGTQLAPEFVPPFAGLAKVAWARGHLRSAIGRYRDVVARYPLPEYVIALGDLYRASGQPDLAAREDGLLHQEEQLLRAAGVNLDLEQALFESSHGDPQAGLVAAQAEWARRHSVQVADALAWALYENGRYAEAARYSKVAMHLGMRNALFFFHAGMIQLKLGNTVSARSLLSEVESTNPYFSIEYSPVAERTLARLGGAR